MNNLKICVYAISKNEEQFVKRFYESAKDADLIVLADTGSTDDTVSLARSFGIVVYEISVVPWRFDIPRNIAMALIPENYDVCVSIDLDEILQPGWREEIERLWVKDTTNRMSYQYTWGEDVTFYYEKIHSRNGFQWKNICHEVLVCDTRITESWVKTDMLMVVHLPDKNKSRSSYLALLEADYKENQGNIRNILYYGRELVFHSLWSRGIEVLDKFLELEKNDRNERCYALRFQGQSYIELGDKNKALESYRKAIIETPDIRDGWVDLAFACYIYSMWNECFYASTQALNITYKPLVYTSSTEAWGPKPYDLAAISAWNLGLYDKAIEYGTKAVELSPNDERLKNNLQNFLNIKNNMISSSPPQLS
jgi:glycosyltransferase involved in cell wall biosynthesis